MMTVKEASRLTGVSVRTLQYYDNIGLLPPAQHTEAGYRLYDEAALDRLQQIMLFRELGFSLKEIRQILSSPDYDRQKALQQQIELLVLQREHLDNLIAFARGIQATGGQPMDFTAFDKQKQQDYARQAKQQWGHTDAYAEFEEKNRSRSAETQNALGQGLMSIFTEFGHIRTLSPDGQPAQALVRKLQSYITANYYHCTDAILSGLGAMYAAGGEFTENIDAAGGSGTAQFVSDAIAAYVAGGTVSPSQDTE